MAGTKTQFKAKPLAAGIPEHKLPSVDRWRANPDQVKWWREQLETPQGQELVSVIRDLRLKLAATSKGPADERLGRILGQDELFHVLFVLMANGAAVVSQPKKPGTPIVPPHQVQVPA